jgi:predicted phosphodiesterase
MPDAASAPVVFVWPGDLHLETADRENYRAAEWMIEEVNHLIRPDFVQFAGDNAQHATAEQFALFMGLARRLHAPFYPLVGDHDVHHDPRGEAFRAWCGEPYGAFSLRGFRFIRLNTMEFRPLGMSDEQVAWFRYEVDRAVARGERPVVFQHHYPYQIWESFEGPGIDTWRQIVQTRRITAIFAGHTHYGQIANDGRNLCVATRSIGDPEGGPPSYTVCYLHGDDLALACRSQGDHGPLLLITHPRRTLLAQDARHIVQGADVCRVRIWAEQAVQTVRGRVDGGEWFDFSPDGACEWAASLPGDRLAKGEHQLEVEAADVQAGVAAVSQNFMVDRSGRYTAVPQVDVVVKETRFC